MSVILKHKNKTFNSNYNSVFKQQTRSNLLNANADLSKSKVNSRHEFSK